ncbi:MAG: hypothetical protein JO318_16020, partial [Chloroflexi bacterium]|nr:hypothetical protein [Chloroflexota bacterium]
MYRPLRRGVLEFQLAGPPDLAPYADNLDTAAAQMFESLAVLRAQFKIVDAACMVNLPFWSPLVERLRKRFGWKIVYDCLDDYAGFSNTSRRMLRAEEVLAREANLVLVTSRHLLQKQSSLNKTSTLVPNASDFQHFRFGANARPAGLPAEESGRPIIGYYG